MGMRPAGARAAWRLGMRLSAWGYGESDVKPGNAVISASRLWYNGKAVDTGPKHDTASRFGATIGAATSDYFARGGFALSTRAGKAHASVDATVGAQCGPFVPFGIWSITQP